MHNTKDSGFTLVELAIVMIIIGLLIGGVLKGQELIDNARVSGTIAQVEGVKAAYYTFRDTYGGIAGDMANANTRLSGCGVGNTNNCQGGTGNSIIGDPLNNCGIAALDANATVSNIEAYQFWKHLALADLITGIDPTAPFAAAIWGETHPASPFGGGFSMCYSTDAADNTFGHTLRLSRASGAIQAVAGNIGNMLLNPLDAANIDRKLDDGQSNAGWVQAEYFNTQCDNVGNTYNEQTDSKNCMMLFTIDQKTKMSIDPKLLEILVCPLTKSTLRYDKDAQELISEQAKLAYPIRDGIPIMLVDEARALD